MYENGAKEGLSLNSHMNNHISNQMIQSFLNYEPHYQLFIKTIDNPTHENQKRLNRSFKDFYNEIRFKKYISTAIWRHARDCLSKEKRERTRYLLIMDQSIGNQEKGASYGEQVAIEDNQEDVQADHLIDHIENPELYVILRHLTKKQLQVLDLYILHQLTHREIASLLDVSQQAVSKTIRQSLAKIRDRLEEGEEGDGDMG